MTTWEGVYDKKFRKKDEYWSWFAWTVYLIISVDLLMTSIAINIYGVGNELNPIMAEMFKEGLLFVVTGHITILVFCTVCFLILLESFDQSSSIISDSSDYVREKLAIVLDTWIGLLLSAGMIVFTNNLLVVLGRPSLIDSTNYLMHTIPF